MDHLRRLLTKEQLITVPNFMRLFRLMLVLRAARMAFSMAMYMISACS